MCPVCEIQKNPPRLSLYIWQPRCRDDLIVMLRAQATPTPAFCRVAKLGFQKPCTICLAIPKNAAMGGGYGIDREAAGERFAR